VAVEKKARLNFMVFLRECERVSKFLAGTVSKFAGNLREGEKEPISNRSTVVYISFFPPQSISLTRRAGTSGEQIFSGDKWKSTISSLRLSSVSL
jgi:hypothetical protein